MRPVPPPPVISYQDWGFLCGILAARTTEELTSRPFVPSPARLAPGERALLVGPAQRHTWKPQSAVAYRRDNMFAFGSLSFVVAAHAINEAANAMRKSKARAEAQGQWVIDGAGPLTVTTHGAHFTHPDTWAHFAWGRAEFCDMDAADLFQIHMVDDMTGHRIGLRFRTIWAPLVFVLTALSSQPGHPRLHDRSWVPPHLAHVHPEVPALVADVALKLATGQELPLDQARYRGLRG
ncbi:hypothetical protein [Nonomuraea sp. SBT364]|uniref:hypothetical protein n=1 Tax=Nonomuraea sp. SBT364 TaxID=1580530 RepID=UPI00066DF227|nr:hypothetical protein [Nonomuraea sp. SBT364]